MKNQLIFWLNLTLALSASGQAVRVGIGTTSPRAGLDIQHNDGLLVAGGGGSTDDLPTGAGTRLLWIPQKAAFRAGGVTGDAWNPANVGANSLALGYSTGAFATSSTAWGDESEAWGIAALAFGHRAMALGNYSTALGFQVETGPEATGSVALGDATISTTLTVTAANQFAARFDGGYRLFTKENLSAGVSLASGGNAWSMVSDSTKKENFREADGAQFLRKIAGMRLGSWNYRGQDARTMRHYGPTAQDFFSAFGRDGVGTIGCDTLINQADFDGVNLIAIQALTREVEDLRQQSAEIERLRAENDERRRRIGLLARRVRELEGRFSASTPAIP